MTTATATPLEAFHAEIERRAQLQEDFVADTRRIGYYVERGEDDDEAGEGNRGKTWISVDGVTAENGDTREFFVNEHAHRQLAGRLQVPWRYYERLRIDHPDLLENDVRELLHREPQVRMIRTLDGTARAYLSDRYRRIDHYQLFTNAIAPALGETHCEIKGAELTDLRMYIKVIFPDLFEDVRVGDAVFGGILIRNSEVGAGMFNVEPVVWRKVCSNGLIVPVHNFAEWGLKKQHVGRRIEANEEDPGIFSDRTLALDDAAFEAKVYDVVKNAASGIKFAAMVNKMRDLAGVKIEGDPVPAVERLASTYSITQGEQALVREHLAAGGDLSLWGYVNAVTRSAQEVESYDRRIELERIGGTLLSEPVEKLTRVLAAR